MRWEICFNLSILRMLSFALDLHWRQSQLRTGGSRHHRGDISMQQQPGQQSPGPIGSKGRPAASARHRQHTALPAAADYSVLMYLAHVLYPPLYLAGPIITYQDFAWQLRQPPKLTSRAVGGAVLDTALLILPLWRSAVVPGCAANNWPILPAGGMLCRPVWG